MTRFARAKGSKASNEKAPEDATPWEVMKDQLLQAKKESEDAKNRHAAEQQRIENYENFLKERRVQKRPATWCDFPEAEQSSQNSNKVSAQNGNKVKKNKQKFENVNTSKGDKVTETEAPPKKKKNKSFQSNTPINSHDHLNGDEIDNTGPVKKKKKKDKQKVSAEEKETHEIVNDASQTETKAPKKKKKKKKQMANQTGEENMKNGNAKASNNPVQNAEDKNFSKQKHNKKNKWNSNTDQNGSENNTFTQESNTFNKKDINKLNKQKAKKKKKLLDGQQPIRRKEINDKSFQLIVGGKDVELIRYDGFPIMKKDAERLTELKNSMIKKGIPKSEVDRTMKLERRRAEKALARMRKEVCYNCRKGGHNLSDCPELKSKIPGADAPEGVCFKCGSTEHRQFECKVQRDKEFRFATCFICKEPGHIARQCPDNPKGLYPNGGSCKLCGDVTHLRKDCPTANNKKEDTSVKLQTLDSTEDLEGIGAQNKTSTAPADTSKKPKKIRF